MCARRALGGMQKAVTAVAAETNEAEAVSEAVVALVLSRLDGDS